MKSRFGQSRFSGARAEMGEDVNPSAYIVNLADCMLVLACGFLVALVARYGVNLSVANVEDSDMEAIDDPEEIVDEITSGGTAYIEAGTLYQDAATGEYYIIKDDETAEEVVESTHEGSGAAHE